MVTLGDVEVSNEKGEERGEGEGRKEKWGGKEGTNSVSGAL